MLPSSWTSTASGSSSSARARVSIGGGRWAPTARPAPVGSDHRVLHGLDRPRAHALAGGLRRELLTLLGEWIDPLARGPRGLLHDHELREAWKNEDAGLLELAMTHRHERLDDLLDVLA